MTYKGNNTGILHTWQRLFQYLPMSKIRYIILILIYDSIGIASTFLSGNLLKNLTIGITNIDIPFMAMNLIFYILFMIAINALSWLYFHTFVGNVKMELEYNITVNIFDKILYKVKLKDQDTHDGDTLSRLFLEGYELPNIITWDLIFTVMPLINFLLNSIIVLLISWRIGLAMIFLGLLFILITKLFAKPIKKVNRLCTEQSSKIFQKLYDFMNGYQTLKLMGMEKVFYESYTKETTQLKRISLRSLLISSLYGFIGSSIGLLSSIIVLTIGILLVGNGYLTIGNLLLVYQFAINIVLNMMNIGNSYNNFQEISVKADRVFEILDSEFENVDYGKKLLQPSETNNSEYILSLKDVCFSYGSTNENVIDKLSLNIAPGEHIALVGESGSGKSTIFRLLLGLYQEDAGDIYIYGQNYKDLDIYSIRKHYSYVAQDCSLFNMSIRENILMGDMSATEEEMIQAAKQANAHKFISVFSEGYDTMVGEMGNHLSGGQIQRITIARAILKKASILLFDEATSSLDTKNELEIQNTINEQFHGITMIVAAHRLSTIMDFDRIVVLEKGKILEIGNHKQLMERKGLYYDMFHKQLCVN